MINSPTLLRAVRELGSWAARRRTRFRVTGTSMEPTLADGDFVLVDRTARPTPGDLVLAAHPDDGELLVVKRFAERLSDGRIVVTSDNPSGSDSRSWGPLAAGALRGRVTLLLDRPWRAAGDTTVPTTGEATDEFDRGRILRWLRR